ncbi:glutamate racemase [Spirochaetia bacterium]|nr:glutamate racemase [Spirochaetia bacterium]
MIMKTRPILFLDSGVGGIPYCRHFLKRNSGEKIIYLADRANFPYGKRSREELILILQSLIEKTIARFDPKIAVVACNTATVSTISALRSFFPELPFVGTVPAVKPAVTESQKGRVGVLGTARTIEDPYIAELAAKYGPHCVLHGIAAPELVEFIEYRYTLAGEAEKLKMVRSYLDRFRAAGVDAVVLGCTHFLFLLDEFRREAAPGINIYDSVEGVSRRIESILDEDGNRLRAVDSAGLNAADRANRFLVTGGTPESSWKFWVDDLGFSLSSFGDQT